ncbi:MAG: methionine synthase [Lactobacillales bacterium]|jgi:cobalamin-dependent methionine synthase I|nr:methionine synthase [Lactobacillales bacterium]
MLSLDKSEILRYLGFRKKAELTAEISNMIDELVTLAQEVAKPRYLYRIFNLRVDEQAKQVKVLGTELMLTGKSITSHLQKAKKIALLVVTLGMEIERKINQYSVNDETKTVILEAICNDYIEKICDLAQRNVKNELGNGWTMNRRFSPGYGDLPLNVQAKFLEIMQASKKLGIYLNESDLMIPRKSVTAILGVFENKSL